jgi:chemotaxis family two-component system response regulator PixG
MSARLVDYPQSLNHYLKIKRLQIFSVLKRLGFSGQLRWHDPSGQEWTLFFSQGDLVYGTGGCHPRRQWYRYVQRYAPQIDLNYAQLRQVISAQQTPMLQDCWEYSLLYHWFIQGELSKPDLQTISTHILADLLFDVVQSDDVKYQLVRQSPLPENLVPVRINQAELLLSVQELWEVWLDSDLETYSPNLAPVIEQPDPIRAEVSLQVFQSLMQLLDGQRSLRDLAVKLKKDVSGLAQALFPYIKAGWIKLLPVADFPPVMGGSDGSISNPEAGKMPLIACVDDSPLVCKSMGQVIRAGGYDFVAILEGRKAVPTLLTRKPDMVFLDLIMPETNGYEICGQLRKITRFKELPIVILSGNDGLVDQVRARLLGATDFLSKPMEPIVILSIIQKHLGQKNYSKQVNIDSNFQEKSKF